MDVLAASLEDSLQFDFRMARTELAEARTEQQAEDTAATRRQVAECWTHMDRVLDMWNDVLLTAT